MIRCDKCGYDLSDRIEEAEMTVKAIVKPQVEKVIPRRVLSKSNATKLGVKCPSCGHKNDVWYGPGDLWSSGHDQMS